MSGWWKERDEDDIVRDRRQRETSKMKETRREWIFSSTLLIIIGIRGVPPLLSLSFQPSPGDVM